MPKKPKVGDTGTMKVTVRKIDEEERILVVTLHGALSGTPIQVRMDDVRFDT